MNGLVISPTYINEVFLGFITTHNDPINLDPTFLSGQAGYRIFQVDVN